MRFASNSRWAAGLLAAWLLSGCAQEERPQTPPSEVPAHSGQGNTPFDVQKVMDQVHFAFRPQGAAWEGAHSTYAVRVGTDGFSVTPYHYPREQPEGAKALRSSQEERAQGLDLPIHKPVEGEPVSFGIAHVTRGGRLMSGHEANGQVRETGDLTIARSEVAEHFRNNKDGVEQSWSFEQKPSGTGDLEVRLPVKSGRFLGVTANGLHFGSGSTGLGVRYGHGTWVDAEGQRTPVPARFEANSIVLSVPAPVVDTSTYPAVLDPIVSPEIGMDDPVNGPADKDQYEPAIAHNGTNFLVVWQDYRNGYSDIYAARVSNTGIVLDTTGIRISKTINSRYSPAVAHDGTNFLIVWHEYRGGTSYDIYGARVSGTGTVLDTSDIAISTAINEQSVPAVTHDGTNFLIVWQDTRSGSSFDIYGARVSNTGAVLDISGIPISTAANNQTNPTVASNGTNSLVVWQDNRSGGNSDIYGARVSNTGIVLNTNGILISTAVNAQEYPAVAYNGVDFMVVWQDYRSGSSFDIYGARVSGTGVVRNPSGIAISTATNDQRFPAVAREGANFLVVWQDQRSYDIYGARVNSTGTVLDTGGILISTSSTSAYTPSVAHDGTSFLVVWTDYSHPNSSNIYGARVSGTGTVLDTSGISISRSANGQYTPAVAHDGTNFLVVWIDRRTGSSMLYGARVSETGTVLDTSGIPLAMGNSKDSPAVAHDGANFLVVWHEYISGTSYDIYGVRVSSDGTVLDTSGIPISTATSYQYNAVVAHDGANFLVAWQDQRSGDTTDIYGARVSSDGTVLDTSGIAISTATNSQYNPAVAFNGTNFLVVWQDERNSSNSDIYGARVSSDGTVLDTSGILISTTANFKQAPSVAHNGMYFLVVWNEHRSSTGHDICGARLDSGGTVLDTSGISISAATNSQSGAAVAYDGANFLVVWQDQRSGISTDIYGARVNEMGKVLDTSGIAISTDPENEVEPTVTSMGGEFALVVYRRSNPSPSTNSERVMARLVQSP